MIPCLFFVASLSAASTAGATFIANGNGLIYDTVNNLTWTQNASISGNIEDWLGFNTWVSNLDYAGITGWELPDITQLANLYTELDGPSTNRTGNQGPFTNIQRFYWSGTLFVGTDGQPASGLNAWFYDFQDSGQFVGSIEGFTGLYAWAVQPGDVSAAPEPGTLVLLASALVGFAFLRLKHLPCQKRATRAGLPAAGRASFRLTHHNDEPSKIAAKWAWR
jgi:hypothetical protein